MSQEPDDTEDLRRSIATLEQRLAEAELAFANERNGYLEALVQLGNRLEVQQQRNESLAAINAEVEQRCEKLEALLVDIYNTLDNGGMIRDDDWSKSVVARMREIELLDEAPAACPPHAFDDNGYCACGADYAQVVKP